MKRNFETTSNQRLHEKPTASAVTDQQLVYFTKQSTQMQAAKPQPEFPHQGLAKEPAVTAFMTFSRSTLWNQVREGTFPKPIKIGARAVAWRAAEVRAHVDSLGA